MHTSTDITLQLIHNYPQIYTPHIFQVYIYYLIPLFLSLPNTSTSMICELNATLSIFLHARVTSKNRSKQHEHFRSAWLWQCTVPRSRENQAQLGQWLR